MTKRKSLLLLIISFVSFLGLPLITNAEGVVTVYLFRGEGCSHCAAAEAFFKDLKQNDEYKDMFVLRDFEIWHDKDNSNLADKVAVAMGDEALKGSVPYIVIGNKTWKGYSSGSNDAIKKEIKETFEDADFVDPLLDIVPAVDEEKNNGSNLAPIIILAVAGLLIGGTIYLARKESEEELIKETSKSVKNDLEKENVQPEREQEEKTISRKQTSNKKASNKKKNSKKNKKK